MTIQVKIHFINVHLATIFVPEYSVTDTHLLPMLQPCRIHNIINKILVMFVIRTYANCYIQKTWKYAKY